MLLWQLAQSKPSYSGPTPQEKITVSRGTVHFLGKMQGRAIASLVSAPLNIFSRDL